MMGEVSFRIGLVLFISIDGWMDECRVEQKGGKTELGNV